MCTGWSRSLAVNSLCKTKCKLMKVPGKTYALTRKSNEMCSVIFKQWFDVDRWQWLCLVRNRYKVAVWTVWPLCCWWYTVLPGIYIYVSFVHNTFLFKDFCLIILIIKYHRNNKEMFRLQLGQKIQFNLGDWDGQNKCHVWRKREMHMKFWWGTLKAGEHLQDLGIDGRVILE